MRHVEGLFAFSFRLNINAQNSNIDMAGIETANTRAPCPSVRVITQDAKNTMSVRRVRSRTPTDESVFMGMMLKQTSLFVCNYVHHAKLLCVASAPLISSRYCRTASISGQGGGVGGERH